MIKKLLVVVTYNPGAPLLYSSATATCLYPKMSALYPYPIGILNK